MMDFVTDRSKKYQYGFSMAEVIVAVALTSISAAGIITGLSYAKKSQKENSYREAQAKFIQSFENVLSERVRDFVADDCTGHRFGYAAGNGGAATPVEAAFSSFQLAATNNLGGEVTYTTAPTGYASQFAAAAALCASPKPTNDTSGKGTVGAGEYARFCLNFTMSQAGVMSKTNSFWNMDKAFATVLITPIQGSTDAPIMCSAVRDEGQAIKVMYSIYASYNPRMSSGSTEVKGIRSNGIIYLAGTTPAPGAATAGSSCLFAVSGTYTGSLGLYGSKFPYTLSGNVPAPGERFDNAGGIYLAPSNTPYHYNVGAKLIDKAVQRTFDSFVIPPGLHVIIRKNDGVTTLYEDDSGASGIIGESFYYWNKYPTAYFTALKRNPFLPNFMKQLLALGRIGAITPVALHPGFSPNLATDAAWIKVTPTAGGPCDFSGTSSTTTGSSSGSTTGTTGSTTGSSSTTTCGSSGSSGSATTGTSGSLLTSCPSAPSSDLTLTFSSLIGGCSCLPATMTLPYFSAGAGNVVWKGNVPAANCPAAPDLMLTCNSGSWSLNSTQCGAIISGHANSGGFNVNSPGGSPCCTSAGTFVLDAGTTGGTTGASTGTATTATGSTSCTATTTGSATSSTTGSSTSSSSSTTGSTTGSTSGGFWCSTHAVGSSRCPADGACPAAGVVTFGTNFGTGAAVSQCKSGNVNCQNETFPTSSSPACLNWPGLTVSVCGFSGSPGSPLCVSNVTPVNCPVCAAATSATCSCFYDSTFFSGTLGSCVASCQSKGFETGVLANSGAYCNCTSVNAPFNICPGDPSQAGVSILFPNMCTYN